MSLGVSFARRLAYCFFSFSLLFGAGPAEYILETQPAVNVGALAAKYRLSVVKQWPSDGGFAYLVRRPDSLTDKETRQLRSENGVKEVEPNVDLKDSETGSTAAPKINYADLTQALAITGNSNFYGALVRNSYLAQRAVSLIRGATALAAYGGAPGVVVAVIDTGVDPYHPALRNRLLPGYDFTRDLPGTASEMADLTQSTVAILDQSTVAILDQRKYPVMLNQSTVAILDGGTARQLNPAQLPAAFGHGTMVAGLIHLVAPQAYIMPLKAFRADGSSDLANIVRAIRYAADNGAQVISMSFSLTSPSAELKAALDYAGKKGVFFVASAGNDGREKRVYPAAYRPVVGVGSTNSNDRHSGFSNYGDGVRTSSPGEALITTYPGGHYAGVWGTSFSTAILAGAMALVRNTCPSARADKLMDILNAGPHIAQDMGDARLDIVSSLSYCRFHQ